ncbi:hypothetical protein [Parvibaculum sp.]|jgi:hypothetical protein|uniref:hypothetical protein n=1 Tax=Parvibaculum sp. TaxID=2024848 RepID=UPI000C650E81|nr:hypothetical protein [Parvibaculum sp.]HAC59292.1 hypothetical protein [Rhodobiaceae bacterium]MAU60093.1 hypothetical protein [Parvibaculum sp.]MBO6669734.1 hypothetical protein [Parvibaculum sp.]MBO6693734.1 hypothetical protein [Parvibaculum sp.]MBO6716253.1 hypothetical protein [Parvibaculum sp.]|tara:strand:- start:1196 stop:1396 length:201 start_codon:yes stop_codon:yes gene_type:complete
MSVSSLASAAVASQQGQLAQAMQTAMLKAGNEQEKAIVDMLTEAVGNAAAKASAPAGTGLRVDTSA